MRGTDGSDEHARVAERVSSGSQQKAYRATLRRFVAWTALRQAAAARRAPR